MQRFKTRHQDPQRNRVYGAETKAWERFGPCSPDFLRGGSWYWIKRDIRAVLRDPTVVRRYRRRATERLKTLKLRDGRGARWRGGSAHQRPDGGYTITLRKRARTNALMLHEIAHVLTDCSGHGARYVRCNLFLVRRFIGIEAWRLLRDEYRKARVIRRLRVR
jgi:putative metallohydrolase (TIGR04338 family)